MLELLDEPFYIDFPLANYYAQDGDLNDNIQQKTIDAFTYIIERCCQKQITKMAGVATAIFRKADKSGPLLFNILKQMAENTFGKDNVNFRIVSQELERKLGFLTAVGVSPEFEVNNIVSWDSGNSSFQLVLKDGEELKMYQGNLGIANCAQLFIENIRKESCKARAIIRAYLKSQFCRKR